MRVDLHVHTSASDGRLRPAQVVRLAVEQGVSVLAITDHDSFEGVEEAMREAQTFHGLLIIPGVEISSDASDNEVHVLGYCFDHRDRELTNKLKELRWGRIERARKMVAKLGDMGVHVDWERVQELADGGAVGRPHVAQAMIERGHVVSLGEAFDRYIGRNGPAYVEREKITPDEAVRLIVRSGGFALLAHPGTLGDTYLVRLLDMLEVVGLVGIEAYYGAYSADDIGRLVSVAEQRGLMLSGGSDYHGFGTEGETVLGNVEMPSECVERFLRLAREHSPDVFGSWSWTTAR